MSTSPSAKLPIALRTARRQFDRWRHQHRPRARLPEELWQKAAMLACRHGLNRTASALGLKYYSLKKRMAEPTGMIQVTPQMRILVAVEPADFRKGIDGLARVCREVLRQDPFSGYVFVFGNRRRQAIKVLIYDGQGFWLCQKRLSKGRFPWWPRSGAQATERLAAHQLGVLLSAGDPNLAKGAAPWRRVDAGPSQ